MTCSTALGDQYDKWGQGYVDVRTHLSKYINFTHIYLGSKWTHYSYTPGRSYTLGNRFLLPESWDYKLAPPRLAPNLILSSLLQAASEWPNKEISDLNPVFTRTMMGKVGSDSAPGRVYMHPYTFKKKNLAEALSSIPRIHNSSSRGSKAFVRLHGHQALTWYTNTHVGKTFIYIKKVLVCCPNCPQTWILLLG